MDNNHYVVCGDSSPNLSIDCEKKTTRLHLYGDDDDHKIILKINELQVQMFKDTPPRFRDLLDIATYVYVADQTSRRGAYDVDTFGSCWRRHFHFFVPVRDVEFWNSPEVWECLTDTLNFLSDDRYEFTFSQIQRQDPFQSLLNFNDKCAAYGFPEQVVMYSGSLDSLGGAVEEVVNLLLYPGCAHMRSRPWALILNHVGVLVAPRDPPPSRTNEQGIVNYEL